jgi:hypothetical protein
MIRVLHITADDKFFDKAIVNFESDPRLSNKGVIFVSSNDYKLKLITSTEKVQMICGKKNIAELLMSDTYDVVFFYSLRVQYYPYFKYIPKNRIVIWWMWGYELYSDFHCAKPFIPIKMYKPRTNKLVKEKGIVHYVKETFSYIFLKPYYECLRKKILKRIDYFQPVVDAEFDIMCNNFPVIKGSPFYYKNSMGSIINPIKNKKDSKGAILFGNSASYTNNHLDVWEDIKKIDLTGRKIILPLNYGNKKYSELLHNEIHSTDAELFFLDDFLPYDEYMKLLDSCSYAIFGTIRQQAMYNINYCIAHGIKVFLYKDSVVYNAYKKMGFSVYTIEDISEKELTQPITDDEYLHNIRVYNKEIVEKRERVYESVITDIDNFISNGRER